MGCGASKDGAAGRDVVEPDGIMPTEGGPRASEMTVPDETPEPEAETNEPKRKKVVFVEYRVALLCGAGSTLPSVVQAAVKQCAYHDVTVLQVFQDVPAFRKELHVRGGTGIYADTDPNEYLLAPEPPTSDFSVALIENSDAYSAAEEALGVRQRHPNMPLGVITSTPGFDAQWHRVAQEMAGDKLTEVCFLAGDGYAEKAQSVRFMLHGLLLRTKNRWVKGPLPQDEERRLAALNGLKILDTDVERRIDEYLVLAQRVFNTQIAMVSLVDRNRQWFAGQRGLGQTRETPRDQAFCAHTVYRQEPLTVTDTYQDPRFADNPLVTGSPHLRFYSGHPLFMPNGSCIGTLCVADTRPREWQSSDALSLSTLALGVTGEILRSRSGGSL
eukprot:TRINITY_DN1764_c2_g1_i1.p1 TRINITY_DN1764_c2_g1~~TRINITY_DN1764_c2_g1_i1.p1  ORF type:complete len:386 (+),score=72.70 TRINITY_DN1764_c2_g1_i1:62-1219(+)